MNDLENRIKELELELNILKSGGVATKTATKHSHEDHDVRFLTLANHIPGHIAYVNADTLRYEFVNDFFEKSFGIPKEKIIDSHIKDVIGETNYKFALKYINQAKLGQTCSYENTFNLSSGKRWLQVNCSPVFDSKRNVIGIVLVSYDITGSKKTEEIVNQNIGAWALNLVDGTAWRSLKHEQIFGYDALLPEWTFDLFIEHVIPEDREVVKGKFEKAIATGTEWDFECRILRNDGIIFWIWAKGNPVLNENGEAVSMEGIVQDINERKKAELELIKAKEKVEESENGLLEAQRIAKVGNWHIDFSDGYLKWSKVCYSIFEIDKNLKHEKLRTVLQNKIHPEDLIQLDIINKHAIKNIESFKFEYRVLLENRVKNILLISEPVLNSENIFIGTKGTIQDITERKQIELKIQQQNKELKRLNVDKDHFISILGHDLKSPFNGLLGLSELLSKNIHDFDIDAIEKIAADINRSAQRIFNLLDDLLSWARAQQGSIGFEPQSLDLTDVCTDVLINLNAAAIGKNIEIKYLAEDTLDVFADADMLKTVLRNLVSNAIKFTNNGGSININAEQNSENVTIRVRDNGIGIPAQNLTKLFDNSEIITTIGTADETGTGLGLLLCKKFVENHQGKIWVVSEVGKGSEFIFTLPCNVES